MKTGVVAHLFWGPRIFLVLRDKKPEIIFPDCWDSVTETLEPGEDFVRGMQRGLLEEIGIVPERLTMLGITRAGHGFFVGFLTDWERKRIRLGEEGQAFNFFTMEKTGWLDLGGALKHHLEAYPEAFRKMADGELPDAEELQLSVFTTAR